QLADELHARHMQHRFSRATHERAIEVGADEANLLGHEGANLGIHLKNAMCRT
ncbi:MAG: hypothetical protein JWO95_749, partial [Verrucomicrobiales bacterium]|nr:hypothetical protein [Verrucomicrobiales bacterium]